MSDIIDWQATCKKAWDILAQTEQDVEKLKAEIADYRAALEFYARLEKSEYYDTRGIECAREVLKKYE